MNDRFFTGKPIHSLQTMLCRLASCNDKLETVIPDGVFGEDTRKAVTSFQREHDIPMTGIVDLQTWEAIVEAYERHHIIHGPAYALQIRLQPGQIIIPEEENWHMYMINGMLQALSTQYAGMPPIEGGGMHTGSSVDGVKWLQKRCMQEPTGHIDRHTWRMLSALYCATLGDGTGKRG